MRPSSTALLLLALTFALEIDAKTAIVKFDIHNLYLRWHSRSICYDVPTKECPVTLYFCIGMFIAAKPEYNACDIHLQIFKLEDYSKPSNFTLYIPKPWTKHPWQIGVSATLPKMGAIYNMNQTYEDHDSTNSLEIFKQDNRNASISFQFDLNCAMHYFGPRCEKYCNPEQRDEDYGPFTCNIDGTKKCDTGFKGEHCETRVCPDGCFNGGWCADPGVCLCKEGWTGKDCGTCRRLRGCEQGYCTKEWECNCNQNWTGKYCNEPVIELAELGRQTQEKDITNYGMAIPLAFVLLIAALVGIVLWTNIPRKRIAEAKSDEELSVEEDVRDDTSSNSDDSINLDVLVQDETSPLAKNEI